MKTLAFKNYCKVLGLLVAIGLIGCNKDDGPEVQPLPDSTEEPVPSPEDAPTVFGDWEVQSGSFERGNTKYVFINKDNTIVFLEEDELGFKSDYSTNISVSENQIVLSGGGEGGNPIYNYTLEDNELTVILPYEADTVQLKRVASAPDAGAWVKTLTVLDEGIVPWERDVDITFDGNYLLGYHADERNILKIDPNDFSITDRMSTTLSAYAIEIEKSDSDLKQLFQSDNGGDKFYSYIYRSNERYYESEELGSWIRGLASINSGDLWVSSSNEESLYRYKSNGALSPGEILEIVELDFQPQGLDYQDGYLYVTERNRVHKCVTTPEFRAVETYEISGQNVAGLAFDGTYFWLSTEVWGGNTNKLVKVAFSD